MVIAHWQISIRPAGYRQTAAERREQRLQRQVTAQQVRRLYEARRDQATTMWQLHGPWPR